MSRSSSPSGSSSSEEPFIPVTHKKVRQPKARKGRPALKLRTLSERLASSRSSLEVSGYLASCQKQLKDALVSSSNTGESSSSKEDNKRSLACPTPVCVVCLGLGSIADSIKSRDQYALLQALIVDLAEVTIRKCVIYDPVFTEEDMNYFRDDGMEVLLSEHDLIFDVPTLVYMPHCPRSLFDDLLRKNWSVEALKRLVILGNRLDMYDDPAHPSSTSSAKAPFVVKAVPLFQILPLPTDNEHFDVFNDLALEWIPEERLLEMDDSFWEFIPLHAQEREVKRREKGG